MWVPVRVKEDDDVCGGQVDAQAPGTRGQHEDELLAVRTVVLVNVLLHQAEGREQRE